jgi:AraC-like DNA-binding protein
MAEAMYLKDSPTAEVQLSEDAAFSFGRFQSSAAIPDITRPVVGERGYLVALQLKAIPFIEEFFGSKKVASGAYPVGGVSAIDLQDEPSLFLPNPFDALVLHVTQAELDDVAYAHRLPRVERLSWPLGVFDAVVHHLGSALVSSLERTRRPSKLFLDHVLHALHCHLVHAYGGMPAASPQLRGGLSPAQMRRATDLMDAHLSDNIALREVADACELSVSHFARAFKTTFRRAPYQWLTERRVDRARDLLTNSRLPLADIAAHCGFTDQSALNRHFKRIHGIAPGIWRRRANRGRNSFSLRDR